MPAVKLTFMGKPLQLAGLDAATYSVFMGADVVAKIFRNPEYGDIAGIFTGLGGVLNAMFVLLPILLWRVRPRRRFLYGVAAMCVLQFVCALVAPRALVETRFVLLSGYFVWLAASILLNLAIFTAIWSWRPTNA